MPKRSFSLREGEPPSIELVWRGIWKEIQVSHEGRLLGTIPNQKALKEGATFTLPDGSELHVKLATGMQAELQVLRNGQPLPGSGSDPAVRLKAAAGVVWFIAGMSAVLGLVAVLGKVEVLQQLGLGWESVGFGVLFAVLAWFVGKRSKVALGIALALFILDTVLSLVVMMKMSGRPNAGGVVVRIFLMMPMFRGFGAITALQARDALRKAQEHF